ncbi:MAG TPA: hypothetical protein VGJ84_12650, partial [Polyangiaceae bacterium]
KPAWVASGTGKKSPTEPAELYPGFIVLSSTRSAEKGAVQAMLLSSRGERVAGPVSLTQSATRVFWLEAVKTRDSNLLFWADQHGPGADVFCVRLGADGQAPGEPREPRALARDVRAWQATATDGGAALAVVRATSSKATTGSVELLLLDSLGSARGKASVVNAEATANPDLDLIFQGGRLLIAWSDVREGDAHIFTATAEADGKVTRSPLRATRPLGEQTLVRLVTPFDQRSPGYLAWEYLGEQNGNQRKIHVTRVTSDGVASGVESALLLSAPDDTVPELAAGGDGISALTVAPACLVNQSCKNSQAPEPIFVQLDTKLEPVAVEPLRRNPSAEKVASAWGLACVASGCMALAAQRTNPAPVFAVELVKRSTRYKAPVEPGVPKALPRAREIQALGESEVLAAVDAASGPDSTLAAWVTYFDPTTPYQRLVTPAPDGRYEPTRARLMVRALGKKPTGLFEPQTISLRANSLGGVSVSASDSPPDEFLVGWSAPDQGQAQAFVTLVDARGKRRGQRLVSRGGRNVSDVAAAPAVNGWLLGWIDERDGDPEVYVQKLTRSLQRVGTEQRITKAPGAATGLRMLSLGPRTLLVWADTQGGVEPGWADIFAEFVQSSDGAPLGAPVRLLETRPHSHSPAVKKLGSSVAVAWVEAQAKPSDPAEQRSGVRVGRLDAQARFVEPPALVEVAEGTPSGVALECSEQRCNVAVSAEVRGRSVLQAFQWNPGKPPAVQNLLSLRGPSGQSVSPVLSGGELFCSEQLSPQRARVRRLLIDWE